MYRFWQDNATVFYDGRGYGPSLDGNASVRKIIPLTGPQTENIMSGVRGVWAGLRGNLQAIAARVVKIAFFHYLIIDCEKCMSSLESLKPREVRVPNSAYVVWSAKKHAMGIPIIDEQHRALVSTINSLFFLIRYQRPLEAIQLGLKGLQQHAEGHFLTEELLMELTGYPDFEDHKKDHDAFRARTKILFAQSKNPAGAENLLLFLKEWWKEHVSVKDMAYATDVLAGLTRLGKI